MSPRTTNITPAEVANLLRNHPKRWLIPAAAISVLAAVLAVALPRTWEASQALVVRKEAAGNQDGPGKFNLQDEMKTVQETILELTKSNGVLAGALAEVGAPSDYAGQPAAWPTAEDVEALRQLVKLAPPKGAEFGKTEVFYLKVRDRNRHRAEALATAICGQVEAALQHLRDAKARSMMDELDKALHLAKADVDESTRRLMEIETEVGSDLAELRILHDSTSGESALRRTVTEIRNELRQARAAAKSNEQLLALLGEARSDPDRLAAIPNQLIESQPALRRLKEGLAEAQLRTAQLTGGMSEAHPLVQAARESEREIGRNLHHQLATAAQGVAIDLRLNEDRAALLEEQLAKTTERLNRLAALRAPYANLVAETRNRTALLERAEQRLAEARAGHATAKAANLIARIDAPDAGIHPVGPGRATIVVVGVVGGLLAGVGVVLLTAPSSPRLPLDADGRPVPHAAPANGTAALELLPASGLSLNQALKKLSAQHPSGN